MPESKLYKLVAPSGADVIGTFDFVPACALVVGWTVAEDGSLEPEYTGTTDCFWNGQRTDTDDETGEMYVQDENGDRWKISECTRVASDLEDSDEYEDQMMNAQEWLDHNPDATEEECIAYGARLAEQRKRIEGIA